MVHKDSIEYNNSISPILNSIAVPLFENFNITTFSYLRFLKNGQIIHISNQSKWLEYYIINRLYDDADRYTREIRMLQRKEKSFFLRMPTTNYSFEKHMNDFGICYGISIYQELEDYIEMFGFATGANYPNIIETYINEMDLLKRFTVFFKDKAKDLIEHADRKRIITPSNIPVWVGSNIYNKRQNFLTDTLVKHFPISNKYSLTLREAQTLYYSVKGLSIKNIARQMFISPQTVETNLKKIKIKSDNVLTNSILPKNLTKKNYINNIITYFDCEHS